MLFWFFNGFDKKILLKSCRKSLYLAMKGCVIFLEKYINILFLNSFFYQYFTLKCIDTSLKNFNDNKTI